MTTRTYIALLLSTVIASVVLARRSGIAPPARWLNALVPIAAIAALLGVAQETIFTVFPGWSEARLAPALGLRYGYPLYPSPGGVLTGHIYGPMGALVYLPATLSTSPTVALLLGSIIATVITIAPVVWLVTRGGGTGARTNAVIAVFLVSFFTLLGLLNGSLRYALHSIHSDAPALAFGALACCALLTAPTKRPHAHFALAAAFAMLSVWSKQTMVLLFISLPLYVLLTHGTRRTLLFARHLAIVGLLTSAVMVACFGPLSSMFLYMFVVPANHPMLLHSADDALRTSGQLLAYAFPPLAVSALLMIWLMREREGPSGSRPHLPPDDGWRLFLFVGLCNLPMSFLGMAKYGGDRNSASFAVYFLAISATLLLRRTLSSIESANNRSYGNSFVAAALLSAMCGTQIGLSYVASKFPVNVWSNPSQQAYDFARAHPNEVFFPWNPMVGLLTDGIYYHFDSGVNDRLLAKRPISVEDFTHHIPERFQIVAYPPGAWPDSRATLTYLPDFSEPEALPLAEWAGFKRRARDERHETEHAARRRGD